MNAPSRWKSGMRHDAIGDLAIRDGEPRLARGPASRVAAGEPLHRLELHLRLERRAAETLARRLVRDEPQLLLELGRSHRIGPELHGPALLVDMPVPLLLPPPSRSVKDGRDPDPQAEDHDDQDGRQNHLADDRLFAKSLKHIFLTGAPLNRPFPAISCAKHHTRLGPVRFKALLKEPTCPLLARRAMTILKPA
jgi:hypothetical protein